MWTIINFASFEAKKFSPSLRFEAKITKSKRSKNLKQKSKKKRKKQKKNEKIDMNFYGEQAKHMWNRSNFALFRL